MKLNWIGYYPQSDGYGRFSAHFIRTLRKAGVQVKSATVDHIQMPAWMQEADGIDWSTLTISCMPPFMLQTVPGRHWLFTMTEGSRIPSDWVEKIKVNQIERVLVPCEHNVKAFRESGVTCEINVVPGGTDPEEFPYLAPKMHQPYTFLTMADRGSRKGWEEVWKAFYLAFGGKTSGEQNVRLVIKALPRKYPTLPVLLSKAQDADTRIQWQVTEVGSMSDVYAQADCLVLPSRSEGWGMPHREAASQGVPVITQCYSGLDDGHLAEWALVVGGGELKPIPQEAAFCLGEWRIVNVDELAQAMLTLYKYPEMGREFGRQASRWLHQNQTWDHAVTSLLSVINNN